MGKESIAIRLCSFFSCLFGIVFINHQKLRQTNTHYACHDCCIVTPFRQQSRQALRLSFFLHLKGKVQTLKKKRTVVLATTYNKARAFRGLLSCVGPVVATT